MEKKRSQTTVKPKLKEELRANLKNFEKIKEQGSMTRKSEVSFVSDDVTDSSESVEVVRTIKREGSRSSDIKVFENYGLISDNKPKLTLSSPAQRNLTDVFTTHRSLAKSIGRLFVAVLDMTDKTNSE